jgi:hypothetical protein
MMLKNLFVFTENRKPKTENSCFKKFNGLLALIMLVTFLAPVSMGCSAATSFKNWVTGSNPSEEDEDTVPPESQQETVMIDGKPYVRSRNPYWLTYPDQPEYIYVEKGKEFKGMQQRLIESIAKALGKEKEKGAKTIPPDKMQEMVKAEVDRILREQGLGGFVSQGKERSPFVGRSVAVIPDLDTPSTYEGLNRTMAIALGDALGRTKDIRVVSLDQVKEAMGKAGVTGKLNLMPNIKALGDYLGVQGIVLTGIMPPERGAPAAMAVQVYDTFAGTKEQSFAGTVESGTPNAEAVTKFANANALRVGGELMNIRWFGRVDFIKEGKVYLNLGQNAGLKVGDHLKVVIPGKEVVNPTTHAVLGYTSDESQGELKVTELLGNTGAVATSLNGGPFKPNDRVRSK